MAFSPQALECTMLTIPQKTETAEEMQKGIRSAAGGGGGALPALCDSVTTMSPDVGCKLELQGTLKIFQVIGRCACLYIFLLSYIYIYIYARMHTHRTVWAFELGSASGDQLSRSGLSDKVPGWNSGPASGSKALEPMGDCWPS